METILDTSNKCQCLNCMRDVKFHPNYCKIIQKILPTDLNERCRLLNKLYYFKPFACNSWTKDWKSVTHRDYVFRDDHWSIDFPKPDRDPGFEKYVCQKWCTQPHNEPLSVDEYTAQTMPNLFEEPRKTIYSDPRKCCSTYDQDYTWEDDYRSVW